MLLINICALAIWEGGRRSEQRGFRQCYRGTSRARSVIVGADTAAVAETAGRETRPDTERDGIVNALRPGQRFPFELELFFIIIIKTKTKKDKSWKWNFYLDFVF